MRILFTSTNSWFSRTIRQLTEEDVSHVAIEFPEAGVIVHSDLLGVRLISSKTFRKTRNIIYELDILKNKKFRNKSVQDLLERYEGKLYDFGAFIFLGLSLVGRKYLHLPLSKSNLWQATGMFLCTGWTTKLVFNKEDDMLTPKKLYLKIFHMKNQGLLE